MSLPVATDGAAQHVAALQAGRLNLQPRRQLAPAAHSAQERDRRALCRRHLLDSDIGLEADGPLERAVKRLERRRIGPVAFNPRRDARDDGPCCEEAISTVVLIDVALDVADWSEARGWHRWLKTGRIFGGRGIDLGTSGLGRGWPKPRRRSGPQGLCQVRPAFECRCRGLRGQLFGLKPQRGSDDDASYDGGAEQSSHHQPRGSEAAEA